MHKTVNPELDALTESVDRRERQCDMSVEINNERNIKSKFQKLTPTDGMTLDAYVDAMDFVFDNKDLHNIAISGTYSSGKSSLIRSYQRSAEKTFYYVSLTHFNDKKDGNLKDENPIEPETILEKKIVSQLLQQAPKNKVDKSHLVAKREHSVWKSLILGLLTALLVLALFLLTKGEAFVAMISLIWKKSFKDLLIGTIACIFLVFTITAAVLIHLQRKNHLIRKISVHGGEVEFKDDTQSYFDKHLDDILCLLIDLDVDGIVIEDLDRISRVEVFEKLRELNILANYKRKRNQPLRFFYLIRDDIFENKDRTKFFDFIIPVIPVVDSSNSYEILKSYLSAITDINTFNDGFLRGLSLYIDDMRILNNINNEYVLYWEKLKEIKLDPTTLLAIIAYKNIFPKDFASLQLNRGFVYGLFQSKERIIQERIRHLRGKKAELEDRIKNCNTAVADDLEQLSFIDEGYRNKSNQYYGDFSRRDYDNWKNTDYLTKKIAIEDREKENLLELENQIADIDSEIKDVSNYTFERLIDRDNIEAIFGTANEKYISEKDFELIQKDQYFGLLKYLITKDYLNETYADYISYFYPNSLSTHDKIFVRSVKDRAALPQTYALDSPSKVTEYLDDYDYTQEETLNFSLTDYIVSEENEPHKKAHIEQLKGKNNLGYIKDFLEMGNNKELFIVALIHYWPEFFNCAIKSNEIEEAVLLGICYLMTSICPSEDLVIANTGNCLSDFISKQGNYLQYSNGKNETIINNLKQLNVQFISINHNDANSSLFDGVFDNDLYIINSGNIKLILETKCGFNSAEEALPYLLTHVLEKSNAFYDYLFRNIDRTITVYLSMVDKSILDDDAVIVDVLNNDDVSDDNKNEYIKKLHNKIQRIDEVRNKDLWKSIILNVAAEYNEYNIISYYQENGLDDILVDFLNKYDDKLNYKEIIEADKASLFGLDCLSCNGILNAKYMQIIQNLFESFESFNVLGVEEEKIKALISANMIPLNANNLIFFRDHYNDNVIDLIQINIDDYFKIVKDGLFDAEEAVEVLNSKRLSDAKKKKLLNISNTAISIKRLNCSDAITIYIIENLFMTSDIPYLLQSYKDKSKRIKEVYCETFRKYKSDVINNASYACTEALLDIFNDNSWSYNNKVSLFRNSAGNVDKDSLIKVLLCLNAEKIADNIGGGNKRVDVNTNNNTIINILSDNSIIENPELDISRKHYKKIRYKE